MLQSKRGVAASDVVLMVWKIIIVGIVIGTMKVFVAFAGVNDVQAEMLDMQQLVLNMLNSPDLLAYEDAVTGRVTAMSIDMDKFNSTHLENTIRTDRNDLAIRYILTVEGERHDLYYVSSGTSTQAEYEIYDVLASNKRGNKRVHHERVLVKTKGGFAQGLLETSVILAS